MQCLICHKAIRVTWPLSYLMLPSRKEIPPICEDCQSGFYKITTAVACPKCGRRQASLKVCSDCEKWQLHSTYHYANHALYQYNEAMKAYMHTYKFQGDYQLRHVFDTEFPHFIESFQGFDLVVALPIDPTTWTTRGFNQVLGLMGSLKNSAILQMNRAQEEKRQSQKKRQERLKTGNHFQVDVEYRQQIENKRVLLIDDVYTTGRTLRHAAETLYDQGCGCVESVTLCR
ncbi:phosphoribosyltransferase family protein [Pediococcus inopinatus]|jgi:competence protein ComFC|uniref:Phosphoribosyltransferase family protein n=1 Tax=Pediococcus inopinatus TaxID=114090 RepID=A0ABZ0Q2Z9_9LACO|nr:phosphoribosyltransferase family protein [Pediococcus inopinatus]WPC18068.1 phosphoribosyltransferase family protein [Pediococcus inopinatus]WPC19623.1 phosphoribosyltransferase family protein [Pediococcus inopinatus]WPC21322.1 phosphoribosyltransferase family protein [Pediococcus inopinatus]WPP09736.1 phosphoribosyltransferase family protein [Pediococcus inopinatus]